MDLHITAKNPRTDIKVDLFFESINKARLHNSYLTDFEIVGTADEFLANFKKTNKFSMITTKKRQTKLSDFLDIKGF